MNKTLVYITTRQPVKVGDKVSGKRLEKYYAHVVKIHDDSVELLYNGDCKNFRLPFHVIDAELI
jgi:hypothetical protein